MTDQKQPNPSKNLEPAAYLSERELPDPMANDRCSHISKEEAKINPGKRDFDKDKIQPLFAAEDIIQLIEDHADDWAEEGSRDGVSALHGLKSEICSQEVED